MFGPARLLRRGGAGSAVLNASFGQLHEHIHMLAIQGWQVARARAGPVARGYAETAHGGYKAV
jgi:hypothetical protein